MRKQLLLLVLMAGILSCPIAAKAFEFGVVDAAKIFNKYSETQKTKKYLEGEKDKLQKELESRKKEVKSLDDEYLKTAKKLQELRDAKKEKEARSLEPKLKSLRQKLSQKTGGLQKFFETSQKRLLELEEKQMGSLSKNLDTRVDKVIKEVATKYKLKAVFEKRFFYYGAEKSVKDITQEVLKVLNKK
jgi:Skp family chaperone for outer membrane proteins